MPDFWIPPHAAAELAQARRYTADEMVSLAQEHRYKATIPLLYDWMRLGLIGKPEEGERGRWKPQQASLWLKLLETREQPKVHIVHLCNLPVGGWIFFGERMGGVSRAQIQRVMRTWAERQRRPSLEQVRRVVQRLVKLTKTRDAQQVLHAKKQLNELLAREGLDVVGLRDPLILLMEGRKLEKRGQTKGPQGAAFSVETLLTLWETRERERAQFWASLLPRLNRLGLEPAASEHLMEQLVTLVPPPTRSKLAVADRDGAARAEKHAAWKAQCRRRRARS